MKFLCIFERGAELIPPEGEVGISMKYLYIRETLADF